MLIAFIVLVTIVVFSIQMIHNNSFKYQYGKAQDCVQAGKYEKAYEHLNKALKINKNDIDAHLLMVEVYLQLDNLDSAIVMLREALDIEPNNVAAAKMLLQVYSKGSNVQDLQDFLNKIEGTSLATSLGEFYQNRPIFSVEAGTYDKYISVELTSIDNSEIYYTVDGTTPSTSAIKYSGQIRLRGGTTLVRAVAVNKAGDLSVETIKKYTVNSTVPDNPVIKPASGQYTKPTPIQITVPENCKVYYTWDGSEPTQNSRLYSKSLDMQLGKHVLSVVAIDDNGIVSNTIQSSYDLQFATNFTIDQAYAILMQKLGNAPMDEKGAFQLECCSAIEIGGYNLYAFEKVYGTDAHGNKIYGTDKYTFDVLTAETFTAVTNSAGGYDMTPF
jgi:tetratricopeptide (TPR) repeat protein